MDWNTLVSVAFGGVLTLAGIGLQGRIASRSERRSRMDAASLKARDALLQIEAMQVRWHELSDGQRVPLHPDTTNAVQTMRAEVMLISDRQVRNRLDDVAALLLASTSIGAFHDDREQIVRRRLCGWGREVLSASLRGDKQPAEPTFLNEYWRALEQSEDELDAIKAEEQRMAIESERDQPDT